MSEVENQLTDHAYDGIQEYDNPLPGWWKFLFGFFCFFGFFYYLYFNSGHEGRSVHDQYNDHVSQMMELRFAELGNLEATDENILKYKDDIKWLKVGEIVYKTNCTGCHGASGQGVTGPNLTDKFWKNVRKPSDIAKVIDKGANGGAMPAWGNRLGHVNKVVLAAAYIASLQGTDPAGAKPPEGNEVERWE